MFLLNIFLWFVIALSFFHIQRFKFFSHSDLKLKSIDHFLVVIVQGLSYIWLFCNPVDCSPPGFSILGISQARILEWVAISFSRDTLHCCCCWVVQLCPTLCDPMDCSTRRPPCPSPSPGACSYSCPLSRWCHPTISFSVVPFSFCPQSFPASGTFPMSHLFASDDINTGASASASVLQVNIQGWSPLKLTGLISFLFNGLSCVFSGTTIQRHQFFGILPLLRSSCQTVCDHWEDQSLDYTDFVSRVM